MKAENILPYVQILRPSIVCMSAFGVLVGALLAGANAQSIASLSLAAFALAGAGIILNDYYDYEIDRINAPHRPLPSGKIKKTVALIYAAALFIAGILLSLLVNIYCLILACVNSILEFFYARNFKRIAIIGNALDSWFVASTFIFGALSTAKFGKIWFLAVMAFLANMGREIYGDIEDVNGDKKLGLKTLPIVTSTKFAERVAQIFIILAVLISPLPFYFGIFGASYLAVVAFADILFVYSLFQDPSQNQKTTKIAMVIALFAFFIGCFI